jgi:ABC-type dipeptide/oligopeptide/nickel transport system ATPase component
VAIIGAAIGSLMAFAFKDGGIATGPTMGLVGEAGSSEAIIPLNKRGAAFMRDALGMGDGGGRVIQNRIYLDGREIAIALSERQPSALRLMGAMS